MERTNGKSASFRYKLDRFGLRKLGVNLIDAIGSGSVLDEPSLRTFIGNILRAQPYNLAEAGLKDLLHSLSLRIQTAQITQNGHIFSSIHKAKGLEADAVLAVAASAKELDLWLTTDKAKRISDNSDRCRIGYVAFTRAKQLLCIACQQPIDGKLRQRLEELGVITCVTPQII